MNRHALGLILMACTFLSAPVSAQDNCPAGKAVAAIDAYASEPFGVGAWRKMNGLGDPGLPGDSYAYDNYGEGDEWSKLIVEVVPSASNALTQPGYNCRMGYPLETLKARIASFGKASPYVGQWVRRQEAVMKACSGDASATLPELVVPDVLKPADQKLFNEDRAYQQATVAFYANPSAAIPLFRAIAATDSPHKAASRYNIANLLANAKNVTEARAEAKSILADPSLLSVHDITRSLLGYIANLEDTPAGWSELIDTTVANLNLPLSEITSTSKSKGVYSTSLYDIGYVGVTAKKDDWWVTNSLPADATLSKAIADAARKHPMVLWMMAGQSVNQPLSMAPWALVGEQGQAWTASYIDRALALQPDALKGLPRQALESLKAKPDDASRAAMWQSALDAAGKAGASCGEANETGAVTLLALQAVRLSALANRYDEIYAKLPALKLENSSSLRTTILPKLMQNVLASGNLEEGRKLRDALLTDSFMAQFKSPDDDYTRSTYANYLAWVAEDEAHWLKGVSLMSEKLSSPLLNLLPAAKLREFGGNTMFSAEQQALLKRAAWTRNYAVGVRNSDKTTEDMLASNPQVRASLENVKTTFAKLTPDKALLLTILRNPRFGILVNSSDWGDPIEAKRDQFEALDLYDHNDKNWWCPLEMDRQLGALRNQYSSAAGMPSGDEYDSGIMKPVLAPDVVAKSQAVREAALKQHPMVKAVNWKEAQRLANAASAPKLLTQRAIAWGKQSKGDDGAPEALALAVRSTRYGCRWHGGHKAYSKPAQELLKAKFASTTWAQQTPYWFDCMDSQYDAQYNKVASCKPRQWPKQSLPK